MINLNVWNEDFSHIVKEKYMFEARCRHFMHQAPLTLNDWKKKRQFLLKSIRQNAGSFPPSCELNPQIHGIIRKKGFEIRKITFQSRPDFRVTANLYVPEGTGPFPGILGVHGHWAKGKIPSAVQSRCQVLALNGFVVLMVDAFGAGERGTVPGEYEYHGAGIGACLFNIGETLLGMQVYDNMRGIDLLISLDFVDGNNIGVTGASGGGNQTMWIAALDSRVKAAVPVVSVGTFESYITRCNCVCETLPNGLTFMEEWSVLGLIAPNALLMLNALRDENPTFFVTEMIRSFNEARAVYRLYGVEDRIDCHAFDLEHGYKPEMQRHMLGWFKRWLKGEGEGRPCAIPEYQELSENECLCFQPGKRPKTVQSITQFTQPIAKRLITKHLQSEKKINRADKIKKLKAILRIKPLPSSPDSVSELPQETQSNIAIRKFSIQSEPGIPLPTVILNKKNKVNCNQLTVILHPDGKAAFCKADFVFQLIKRGRIVALTDLRATGETLYDKEKLADHSFHDHSRASLWLGRTMLGDWTYDILAVTEFLNKQFPRIPVEIIAFHESALAALCAASMTKRIKKITAIKTIGSYLSGNNIVCRSMAVHVPGILLWGDVSMMAASASCPVEMVNPVDSEGNPFPASKCRKLEHDIGKLTRRFGMNKHVRVFRKQELNLLS